MKTDKRSDQIEIYASTYIDAEIVKSLLEDSGVKDFLNDQYLGTIAPCYVSGGGVAKIEINSDDFETAKLVIKNGAAFQGILKSKMQIYKTILLEID